MTAFLNIGVMAGVSAGLVLIAAFVVTRYSRHQLLSIIIVLCSNIYQKSSGCFPAKCRCETPVVGDVDMTALQRLVAKTGWGIT